jgi:hypothetical protein
LEVPTVYQAPEVLATFEADEILAQAEATHSSTEKFKGFW